MVATGPSTSYRMCSNTSALLCPVDVASHSIGTPRDAAVQTVITILAISVVATRRQRTEAEVAPW
jgi:hypothetical protein